MILRRFTMHVSEQNWFAVWLDLIVVIVGIFLGLQVAEWNDHRLDLQWEKEFFVDLKSDLERDRARLGAVIEFQSGKGARLQAALEKLQGGEALTDEEYWLARSNNTTFFPANGVYESALTSGKIELIRNKDLRYRIMNLYGHHYTRVIYNGEIYDQRVEITGWESRTYYDPHLHQFTNWDEGVRDAVRAEFAFLFRENQLYMGLVNTLDGELSELISELDSKNKKTR